jgi:hypothetical protein
MRQFQKLESGSCTRVLYPLIDLDEPSRLKLNPPPVYSCGQTKLIRHYISKL